MKTSEVLWEVFKATGHIGAYLLYKDYGFMENKCAGEAAVDIQADLKSIRHEKGFVDYL